MNDKILLVDDEEVALLVYRRYLQGKYKVVAVQSGAAGLAAMDESGPFSVVVSEKDLRRHLCSTLTTSTRGQVTSQARLLTMTAGK